MPSPAVSNPALLGFDNMNKTTLVLSRRTVPKLALPKRAKPRRDNNK